MKKIFLSMFMLTCSIVNAQVIPSTPDLIARPTTFTGPCTFNNQIPNILPRVANTGADICNVPGGFLHVMVWDGPAPQLSWNYNNINFGNIALAVNAKDPDVVVANFNSAYYAFVVTEETGIIRWRSYRWDVPTLAFVPNVSGTLKTNSTLTCKNPNVDVDSYGKVGIVWHEEGIWTPSPTITITSTFTNPSTISTVPITMMRSDIYFALGNIDGLNSGACNSCTHLTVNGNSVGKLVSATTNVQHLFEKNVYPDIALPVLSSCVLEPRPNITWLQEWFDPATFSIKRVVKVASSNGACNNPTFTVYPDLNCEERVGRPRIAARPQPNFDTDYSIVLGDPFDYCTPTSPTCLAYNTAILNWWRINGVNGPANGAKLNVQTPYTSLNLVHNSDPVVTFLDASSSTNGEYIVSWTNGGGIPNGSGTDIIARTYIGAGNNPIAGNTYSFVNRGNNCNLGMAGNQQIPSIAGRFVTNQIMYAFHDDHKDFIAYKRSGIDPGTATPLRLMQGNDKASTGTGSLHISPNPFTHEVNMQFELGDEETPESILITDISGKVVDRIQVDATVTELNWKPARDVKEGILMIHFKTNKGSYMEKLVKN